jgi:hypothetical protein
VAYQSWDELTQELAARLPRLADGDTVRLAHEPYFTMLQQAPEFLRADAASRHTLPPADALSDEQEARLLALGWQRPEPPGAMNWWVRAPWPLSGAAALRTAEMMVGALRDVYRIAGADLIDEEAFNAFS